MPRRELMVLKKIRGFSQRGDIPGNSERSIAVRMQLHVLCIARLRWKHKVCMHALPSLPLSPPPPLPGQVPAPKITGFETDL
jgi:hypothetical protein